MIFVLFSFSLLVIAGCQEAKGTRVSNKVAATAEKTREGELIAPSPINRTTNTTGSVMEEIKLRSNGEYKLLDGGAIKISCNRVRGSKPAFTNNTVFYLNGSFSGSAEHNLIPGEYTTAFNKKYSCNN